MSLKCHVYTTGNEDAVTIQSGTFSWDRNEVPVLKKCVCVCVCVCVSGAHHNFFILHHLQYQSEHQAWSVSGSSGSCGSWQVITHLSSPWRNGEDDRTCVS